MGAPRLWNYLPFSVRTTISMCGFHRLLKAYLYDSAYPKPLSFLLMVSLSYPLTTLLCLRLKVLVGAPYNMSNVDKAPYKLYRLN